VTRQALFLLAAFALLQASAFSMYQACMLQCRACMLQVCACTVS
jgi:hypothetical protein